MVHFAGLYIVLSAFTTNGTFDKTASALYISMTACPIGIKCFIGHADKEIVTSQWPVHYGEVGGAQPILG